MLLGTSSVVQPRRAVGCSLKSRRLQDNTILFGKYTSIRIVNVKIVKVWRKMVFTRIRMPKKNRSRTFRRNHTWSLNVKLYSLKRNSKLIATTESLLPTVRLMALRRPMKRHRRGIHYDRSKPKQSWSRKRETWWKLKMWWTTGHREWRWWSGYWGGGGNLRKLWENCVRDPWARINATTNTITDHS